MRRIKKARKYLHLSIIICCLSFSGYAQVSETPATVYFIRTIGNRSALGAINIFVDAEFQCKLNEKKYFTRIFTPGTHLFSVQAEGKKYKKRIRQIPLQLEPGKTYYMQLAVMYATFVNYLYLQEVTENTADLVMPQLKEDRSCAKQ